MAERDDPGPAETRGRRLREILSLIVLVLAVVAAGRYLLDEEEALAHLTSADPILLLTLTGLLASCMVLNGLVTRDVVACFGIRLRIREWMGVTFVTSMLNLVTPARGGAAARAVYLKHAHGLKYAEFAGTIAATVGFTVAANASLGALALALLGIPGGVSGWVAVTACVVVVVSLIGAVVFAPYLDRVSTGTPASVLARTIRGWQTISADRTLLSRLALWTLLNAIAHAIAFSIAFSIAGGSGSYLAAVTSSAFAKMGAIIAITPAALGVFEAFAVVSAQIVGEELAASLLAVLLIRIVSVVLSVGGGAVMWRTIVTGGQGARPGVDDGGAA